MPIEERDGEVHLRMSRGRSMFLVLSFGVGALIGVTLILSPPIDSPIYRLMLLCGTVFFAAFFVTAVRGMRSAEPTFTADENGLSHRRFGLIRWEDVTSMLVSKDQRGPSLTLEVADRHPYNERLSNGPLGIFFKKAKGSLLAGPRRLFGTTPEEIKGGFERVAGRTF